MKRGLSYALLGAALACAPWAAAQHGAPASEPAAAETGMDKHMTQMQADMQRMQEQMDKMRQARDPKERQRLMQEHMQAMHEHMRTMQSMGSAMMMGMTNASRGGVGPAPGPGTGEASETSRRMAMMECRMDMLQMMMDQMMQRDQMRQPVPVK
jgi:hypothetical protein